MNCDPDMYVLTRKDRVPRRRANALSTEGSSSTMAIDGKIFAISITIEIGVRPSSWP